MPRSSFLRCPKCDQPLRLLERIWDGRRSDYVRIYRGACGELVWEEPPNADSTKLKEMVRNDIKDLRKLIEQLRGKLN